MTIQTNFTNEEIALVKLLLHIDFHYSRICSMFAQLIKTRIKEENSKSGMLTFSYSNEEMREQFRSFCCVTHAEVINLPDCGVIEIFLNSFNQIKIKDSQVKISYVEIYNSVASIKFTLIISNTYITYKGKKYPFNFKIEKEITATDVIHNDFVSRETPTTIFNKVHSRNDYMSKIGELINKIGAISEDTENLIQRAASKYKVIIVSPTSFLAYLQTVLQGLKAMQIEESAKDIIKKVGDLGKHLKSYDEYHTKLGAALGTVVNHYNTSNKELKKIDKDVLRISGSSPELSTLSIDKPKIED